MSIIGSVYNNNEVLKSFTRFNGTSGTPDFFKVFENDEIKIGLKTGVEASHSLANLFFRIRVMRSDTCGSITPINTTLAGGKEDFFSDIEKEFKGLTVKSHNGYCSFYMHGGSINQLNELLTSNYAKFIQEYSQHWIVIIRSAMKVLKRLHVDEDMIKQVDTVFSEIIKISTPLNPNPEEVKQLSDNSDGKVVKGEFGGK